MDDRIEPAAISDALSRIAESTIFRNSSRQSRLLAFLVDKALADESERLNAFSIAVDVLGKSEDFDASSDSAVRVEMHRLRRNLAAYYATEGAKDPIWISIPPRTYRPTIERRRTTEEAVAADPSAADMTAEQLNEAGAKSDAAAERGAPFAAWRAESARRYFALVGLAVLIALIAIVVALTAGRSDRRESGAPCLAKRPVIRLQSDASGEGRIPEATLSGRARDVLVRVLESYPLIATATPGSPRCDMVPNFILQAEIVRDSQGDVLVARLLSESQALLWIDEFALTPERGVSGLELGAARMAYALARNDGIAPKAALNAVWPDAAARDAYECLIGLYARFSARFSVVEDLSEAELCQTYWSVENAPADVAALVATYYAAKENVARIVYRATANTGAFEEAARNLDLFNSWYARGLSLWPDNPELAKFACRYLWRYNDHDYLEIKRFLYAAEEVYALEPGVLSSVAILHGILFRDWEKARDLRERAKLIVGDSPLLYEADVLIAFSEGDWDRAAQMNLSPQFNDHPTALAFSVVVYLMAEERDRAIATFSSLSQYGIQTAEQLLSFIDIAEIDQDLKNELIVGIDRLTALEREEVN
ncbi:MAG: hypothetical protein AAFX08_04430 [Pseudomonadota bacterium]